MVTMPDRPAAVTAVGFPRSLLEFAQYRVDQLRQGCSDRGRQFGAERDVRGLDRVDDESLRQPVHRLCEPQCVRDAEAVRSGRVRMTLEPGIVMMVLAVEGYVGAVELAGCRRFA